MSMLVTELAAKSRTPGAALHGILHTPSSATPSAASSHRSLVQHHVAWAPSITFAPAQAADASSAAAFTPADPPTAVSNRYSLLKRPSFGSILDTLKGTSGHLALAPHGQDRSSLPPTQQLPPHATPWQAPTHARATQPNRSQPAECQQTAAEKQERFMGVDIRRDSFDFSQLHSQLLQYGAHPGCIPDLPVQQQQQHRHQQEEENTPLPDAAKTTDEERRLARLKRNAEAAKRIRLRKKQYFQDLEKRASRLEEENHQLREELRTARRALAHSRAGQKRGRRLSSVGEAHTSMPKLG